MFTKIIIIALALDKLVNSEKKEPYDFAANQLQTFKGKTEGPIGILKTNAGEPIEFKEATDTLRTNLIENEYLVESIAQFVRERTPERTVHAKAAGAFGYFEVTNDVTKYTKADFLDHVGKKTPLFARFSFGASNRGTADTNRGTRGFAVKFYTKQGNLDLLALQTPVFSFNDPIFIIPLIHAQARNPVTNLIEDANQLWDILTKIPKSLFSFFFSFGDEGLPNGYRYFDAFPIHTYELENKDGETHYVKFNFMSNQGVEYLTTEQGQKLAGSDPNYMTRDLYNAIENGSYPSWTVNIQVMTPENINEANFDPFSLTKIWPRDKYPWKEVGKIVLNDNPTNHFEQVEQVAFSPANLVPGILGSPDRIFQARRLAYKDAHRYRIGPNFMQLPINAPLKGAHNYNRDGLMVIDNQNGAPNFFPNSFHGPLPYLDKNRRKNSLIGKNTERERGDDDDCSQASEYYQYVLDEGAKERMVANIVASLSQAAEYLQKQAVKLYEELNKDLGHRIEMGLKNVTLSRS